MIPLHWRSSVVTAFFVYGIHNLVLRNTFSTLFFKIVQGLNITVLVNRIKRNIGHSNLFPLKNIWRTFQHVNKGSQHLGGLHTILPIVSKP
ncbi:hypothetical protein D3C73_1526760 [compost metagenome]